jgi:hypothetical protein
MASYNTVDNTDCSRVLIEDCPSDLNDRMNAFVAHTEEFPTSIKEIKKNSSLSISQIVTEIAQRTADLKAECIELAESHPEITQCLADTNRFEKNKIMKA